MTDEAWRAQHVIFEQAALRVLRCPVPVIAAVEGFALAGGCELAILSDFIVASETAVFGVPETTLGIFPGIGGTQLLPRIVGAPLAKELIFTGRRMKADEAKAAGPREPPGAGGPGAGEGRSRSPRPSRATAPSPCARPRRRSPRAARPTSRPAMILAIEAYNATVVTEDRLEGVRAFNEKRKPAVQGPLTQRTEPWRPSTSTLTDDQRALKAGVAEICKRYPGEYWRDLDSRARVPREVRQRADPGRLPRRAHPAGVRRRRARHHRGRAHPRDHQRRRRQRGGLPRPDVHHGHGAAARQRGAEAARTCRRSPPASCACRPSASPSPNAGSDTTKLQTTAVRKGDRYVVNGQKMFISRVLQSDLMLLLARTTPVDQVKRKTDGLSRLPHRHPRASRGSRSGRCA